MEDSGGLCLECSRLRSEHPTVVFAVDETTYLRSDEVDSNISVSKLARMFLGVPFIVYCCKEFVDEI